MSAVQAERAAVDEARVPEKASLLSRLVNGSNDIGGVYSLSYTEATIHTTDFALAKHGGIPRGGWLLAAACDRDEANGDVHVLEDEEVLLLRVRDLAPLPQHRELVDGRMAVVRDAHSSNSGYGAMLDVHTRSEHEQAAYVADVIGVFYADPATGQVLFGAELDNVWASARYRVFMPSAKALSWIASYPRSADALQLGNVRFSSTMRNAAKHHRDGAGVFINIEDFIGKKTAVLGMTRAGKSNTIKTLMTAVYRHAAEHAQSIGQIIFDPQGEYAKVNHQDGTGLRLLGGEDRVRIYTAAPGKDPQEKPLRLNFYETEMFEIAWDMVVGSMEGAEANYVRTFRSADMERPDDNDHRNMTHWSRGYMAFYGLLHRAGYKGAFANGVTLTIPMKDDAAHEFNKTAGSLSLSGGSGKYQVTSPEQAAAVVDWINKMIGAWEKAMKTVESGKKDTEDAEADAARLEGWIEAWTRSDQFTAVADVFKYAKGRGLAGLRELREFHDPTGKGDVNEMVWQDMIAGRLVIIDLSIGSATVTKTMSERLINALVSRASGRFREGLKPIPFQVVVEEAHNLFERGRNATDDPWVRMSKEAAKYEIGLIYATQEVTSVDQRILSNTHNWVIAHLNSDVEIRELAKYYDFGSFGESIKRAEDRGYVRLKTLSSPYIVPTQVAKFDHAMIDAARVAAGLPAIEVGPAGGAQ
jgi:hypothetical protein